MTPEVVKKSEVAAPAAPAPPSKPAPGAPQAAPAGVPVGPVEAPERSICATIKDMFSLTRASDFCESRTACQML